MPDTDLFLQLAQKKPHSPTPQQAPEDQKTALEAPEATRPVSQVLKTKKQGIKTKPDETLEHAPVEETYTHLATKRNKEVKKEGSKEVNKFTSKLVNLPTDPPVNKVGYYFTRREMDKLDTLLTKLKPLLRDRYNLKVTKNDIIRACLTMGIVDWEDNQLTSQLVHLLTSK